MAVNANQQRTGNYSEAREGRTMHDDAHLGDLPEAVPLYRVAPFWRLLALFALVGIAGLFLVTLTFGFALLQKETATTVVGPAPRMMATPVMPAPGGVAAVPQNLPYPVKQDLATSPSAFAEEDDPPRPGSLPSSSR